jgi:ABC-type Fe3+-hydroxamate transport system substrate-binding protein
VRVVSLVPSVTETLLAWGVEPVAVTRFCEQPGLRAVGGTKDPDVDAIVELAPDLVVVNDEENRREDAERLRSAGVALHVTSVHSVADVTRCLTALAAALGLPEHPLFAQPEHLGALQTPQAHRLREKGDARTAFVPVWRRPWMTLNSDTYGSSVLDAMGLLNAYADDPDRYPTVTPEDVAAHRVDLVVAPSEPYPFGPRHLGELRALGPEVRFVDGKDLFWWGVRTPGALERLAQVLAS